ncbi:MAG: Ig-like domain-containing protein, partial [Cyclobacteriaceae bacterium]
MKKYLLVILIVHCLFSVFSQTPGLIYKPAQGGQSVLDPNLDGYTSKTTAGFINDDESESEISYIPLPVVGAGEPFGDLATGPDCGFTDLVKSADNETIYTYSDAVNLLFRFRLGGTADNSKGYTILVDTDQLFGQGEDPDYTPGNPGFEYEITLRTNFGVSIYDIDNNTLTRTEIGDGTVDRPYDDFAQKSIAGSTICGQDYFYDFYVPYADLPFSSSTPIRMVGGTVIKPSGSTGGSLSDIGGIDDGAGITDDLFKDLIDIFPPTSGDDLSNGNPILPRAACPGIDGPIADAATTVTGTSAEIDGTIIELFKNGVSLGTSAVSGGIWSFTSISPALAVGDEMTATAEVSNVKSTSYSNCNPVVVGSTCSAVPAGTNLSCASDRRIVVNGLPAGATVDFYNSASGFVGTATGDGLGGYAFSCNGNFNTGNCSQGGNCGTPLSGSYYYTVTETGKCESDPSPFICIGVAGSEAPTISTTPITTNTTTILGTLAATPTGTSTITLVINGVATVTKTTTTNTSWTISGISGLNVGDIVTVSAQESGECSTVSTNSEPVQGKSTTPIILGDFCVDAAGSVLEVSGISGEDPGSVITIYTRIISGGAETNTGQTSIVAANGSWTVSGLTISAGTFIIATAQTSGELESDFASEKVVKTKTPDPLNALAITSTPINEGDASISGEATVSTSTDLTIQLYIDGTEIDGATATLPQGAIAAVGTWTITGLNVPFDKLYAGGVATVTITNPNVGFCESDPSAGVPIDCKLPVSQTFSATTSTTICSDESITFDVDGAENLIVYQLIDQSGNPLGSSILGNGNPFSIIADGMTSSVTAISLKASKIGISCESTFGSIPVTVEDLTITSSFINPSDCPTPDGSITLSGVSNNQSYDVTYYLDGVSVNTSITSDGSGQVIIPNLGPGNYTDISVTGLATTLVCTSNTISAISLVNSSSPTISLGTVTDPSTCSGIEGSIQIVSSVASVVTYTVNYLDNGLTQSATLSSDASGNIIIPNLDAGIYSNISITDNGSSCKSNTITTVTLSDPNPTIAIAGKSNPSTCGANGTVNLAFTGIPDGSYTVNYDGGSFNSVNVVSGAATISAPAGSYPNLNITEPATSCTTDDNPNLILSDPATHTISATKTNPTTCGGNGTIDLTFTGVADGTYTIDYDGGSFTGVSIASNTATINTTAGIYNNLSVTISGCVSAEFPDIILSDPVTPTILLASSLNPTSSGGTDGSIFLNFTGVADGTYTIDYQDAVPSAQTFTGIAVVSGVAAITGLSQGSYNDITITINGCTSIENIDVTLSDPVVPTITLNSSAGPTTCGGVDGSITLDFTGVADGTYTIDYQDEVPSAQTFTNISVTSGSATITGLSEGIYNDITITTAGGTSIDNVDVTLNDPTPATIFLGTTTNPTTCSGNEGSIQITGLAVGVTYTVNYTDGVGAQAASRTANVSGEITINNLFADAYTNISVTENGCTSNIINGPVNLSDPTSPTISLGSNPEICAGENTASLSYSATSGSPNQYSIDFDATAEGQSFNDVNLSALGVSPITIAVPAGAVPGTYNATLTVTNSTTNCVSSASAITITVGALPSIPTVNSLLTNQSTPTLTGTADSGNTITVAVGGATYVTTANGSGDWSIDTSTPSSGTFSPNLNGVNEVQVTASDGTCSNADATTNELTIDTTAPATPTVDALTTNDASPVLTGTTEAGSTVTVIINGVTFETTADGSGDWSVNTQLDTPTAGGPFVDLTDGTYEIAVTSTDAAGNSTPDATNNELTVDTADPVAPTVDVLTTNDPSPVLTGTAEAGSTVTVVINGVTFETTADGSGDWSVNTEVDTPTAGGPFADLVDGNYEVAVTSTDAAGNSSVDATNNELTVDTVDPAVPTVDALTTNDPSPVLTGTAEAGNTVTVVINGVTFETTADGSGDWSVNTQLDTPTAGGPFADLADGTYEVAVTSTDAAGNSTPDGTNNELTIDTLDPAVPTVDALTTNDPSPVLTGTAEAGSTVTVVINGVTFETTADGSGNWSVNTQLDVPTAGGPFVDLGEGTYDISVTSEDAAGNSSSDATTNELSIDTTAPVAPTVNALTTNDPSPVLTGTAEAGSTVTVIINGVTFETTADGSGNWSVNTQLDVPTAGGPFVDLGEGTYDISVTS